MVHRKREAALGTKFALHCVRRGKLHTERETGLARVPLDMKRKNALRVERRAARQALNISRKNF
eukprot:1157043-Pelagomonas_calceolata.AAC.6